MTKKFELEKRALLKKRGLEEVLRILNRETIKVTQFKRFSIVFWKHPELTPDTLDPIDFRIRIIKNGPSVFTIKHGDWRGGAREEYEFHFDLNELSSVVNLLRVLGYKWGTTTFVERNLFKHKGLVVTLDKYLDDNQGILEIEAEVKSRADFKEGEEKIDKLFSSWKIKPLTKNGFVDFIKYTNNKRGNYFDISGGVEKSINLWKKKFSK